MFSNDFVHATLAVMAWVVGLVLLGVLARITTYVFMFGWGLLL